MTKQSALRHESAPRAEAVELVAGRLYVMGGTVALDGRITWVPRAATGHQAINCYLLLEGTKALLIDSGLPVHRAEILDQLGSVLPAGTTLSIFTSRAEMDACGNVPAISARFPVTQSLCGGSANPFDAMDEIASLALAQPDIVELNVREMERRGSGHIIDLGPERQVVVVPPAMRMIHCFWTYDPGTRTLFTADAFGQQTLPTADYRPLAADADPLTFESFAAFTKARYWWIDHTHTHGLRAKLASVFDERPIERIAPTHGCVISGRAEVEHQYALMQRLLEEADASRMGEPK